MNYKATKIRLFIWASIFTLVVVLFVSEYLKIKDTETYTNNLQQEIIQEKDSIQAFDTLVKTASNIKADSEKANTFFIKRDEVVNFLDTVESLASSTKTQITIQSVSDKSIATSSALLSVSVKVTGSYSNLNYLTRMIEELPYQTEIQSIRFSNQTSVDDKKQGVSTWSADINIVGVMF